MARVAGTFFTVAAVFLFSKLVIPHPAELQAGPMFAIVMVTATAAAVLLLGANGLPAWTLRATPLVGTFQISLTLVFNGERRGGAPLLDELFYLWIVLWSAYYLSRLATAFNVGFIAVCYASALAVMQVGDTAITRWMSVVGAVLGCAVVVRLLSEQVQRLFGELENAARTDSLTGLSNRRDFEERAAVEFARVRRTGGSFALVVADLDRFKELNDRRGHLAGDVALRAIAALLRRELRTVDVVARLGGDEFAMLLPDVGEAEARLAAERLIRSVASSPVDVGMSLGVSVHGDDGNTLDELISAADQRLYDMKRASRAPRAPAV